MDIAKAKTELHGPTSGKEKELYHSLAIAFTSNINIEKWYMATLREHHYRCSLPSQLILHTGGILAACRLTAWWKAGSKHLRKVCCLSVASLLSCLAVQVVFAVWFLRDCSCENQADLSPQTPVNNYQALRSRKHLWAESILTNNLRCSIMCG